MSTILVANVFLSFISISFLLMGISWLTEIRLLKERLAVCNNTRDDPFSDRDAFESTPKATRIECATPEQRQNSEQCLREQIEDLKRKLEIRTAEVVRALASRARDSASTRNDTRKIPWILRLEEGGLCPANISSTTTWAVAARNLKFVGGEETRGGLLPGQRYKHIDTTTGPMSSQWYCDKFATNLDPYVEPVGSLDASDIVVGLFTGERLFLSRAMASAATWLTHFPNSYIYAATADPTIPIVGLKQRYPALRSDVESELDVQPIQMLAVRDMYVRHPSAKWFYIVGDDLFAIADHMVRMLEPYDPSVPRWCVGTCTYACVCVIDCFVQVGAISRRVQSTRQV
jgi:hypothetical protein